MVSVRGVTTQSVKILSTESANPGAVASVTMLLVGLTGGIGSGKSTVSELLRQKGAVIVDADEVARAVVEPGEPALAALVERFGPGILDGDGRLDRPALAAIAFADDDGRKALGDITWPAIGEEFERRIKEAPDDAVVVCDVPLLVESKNAATRPYVAVIVVEAPVGLRLDRLETRGVARDDAERRMAAQATDEERREVATHVVDNGGDLESLAAPGRGALGRPPHAAEHRNNCRTPPLASRLMPALELVTDLAPAGDQPEAIAALAEGIERGDRFQTLLGITGSGKSATIAVDHRAGPAADAVLAPNKSLAAQLANEFREFFPKNRVEYFVCYYDYYQPEAYLPSTDTYIEKDSLDQRRDRPAAPLGHRARC